MKSYEHLTSEKRAQIEVLRNKGYGPTAIAQSIGSSPSTVSRELRRNRDADGKYAGAAAQEAATARRANSVRPSKLTEALLREIREWLEVGRSPDQIAGRWAMEGRKVSLRVSHETIYQVVARDRKEGGILFQSLPKSGKKPRRDRVGASSARRANPLGMTPEQDITARPEVINNRERVGDLEVDLIIGAEQQGVILVVTDRLSRHTQAASLPSKEADVVEAKLLEMLSGRTAHSLTFDRGLEWSRHKALAAALAVLVFFCKPYHSWEKGTVENTNGRIRRFLPKWASFPHEEMDHEWLQERVDEMNNCPRKVLGYRTPNEVEALLKSGAGLAAA
jgi:IS30 family transposase